MINPAIVFEAGRMGVWAVIVRGERIKVAQAERLKVENNITRQRSFTW
jgi:hypothetical protein